MFLRNVWHAPLRSKTAAVIAPCRSRRAVNAKGAIVRCPYHGLEFDAGGGQIVTWDPAMLIVDAYRRFGPDPARSDAVPVSRPGGGLR